MLSSSWVSVKVLRIASPGIAMNISESHVSIISLKALYLVAAASMVKLRLSSC